MEYKSIILKMKIHSPGGNYTVGFLDLESSLNQRLRLISEQEGKIISVNQSQSNNEIVITIIYAIS